MSATPTRYGALRVLRRARMPNRLENLLRWATRSRRDALCGSSPQWSSAGYDALDEREGARLYSGRSIAFTRSMTSASTCAGDLAKSSEWHEIVTLVPATS